MCFYRNAQKRTSRGGASIGRQKDGTCGIES